MGAIKLEVKDQVVAAAGATYTITKPTWYSLIKGEQVIKYAAQNSGMRKAEVVDGYYAILQTFKNYVLNGHSVVLPGIGTFRLSCKTSAVETDEDQSADNVKRVRIIFTPSTLLRQELYSTSLEV